MGLLSMYPVIEQEKLVHPTSIWVKLDLGDGQTLMLANVHLLRPRSTIKEELQTGQMYEPNHRDEQIRRLRKEIAPLLERGEPFLLVGDFNLTERDPAYHELTEGLHDAHRQAGWGTGHSWRPNPKWNFGLLRIDYLLNSPNVTPLQTSVDCTPRGSDHYIVGGTFEVGE
jgi:vancomycin resistance protein VanJ